MCDSSTTVPIQMNLSSSDDYYLDMYRLHVRERETEDSTEGGRREREEEEEKAATSFLVLLTRDRSFPSVFCKAYSNTSTFAISGK